MLCWSVARGHQRADTLKPYSQKTSQSNHTRTTALSNLMKPSHACRATQDGQVMVERSDRMCSTGEGNGKPLQYSCLENPSIRVFSNKLALRIRWPNFSFNISPSNEHPGLICFRMDWLDLLEVQGTLKSLLQHHGSKA